MATTAWQPLPRRPRVPSPAVWHTSGRRWAGSGRGGQAEAGMERKGSSICPAVSGAACDCSPSCQRSHPARPPTQLHIQTALPATCPNAPHCAAPLPPCSPLPFLMQNVVLEATLLKPQMCIPGADCTGEKPPAVRVRRRRAMPSAAHVLAKASQGLQHCPASGQRSSCLAPSAAHSPALRAIFAGCDC